jgi:hypothetical protein
MWGRSRFAFNGWWTIFRGTRNLEAGRAFMLWLSQSPSWKPWNLGTAALTSEDTAAVESIATEAVRNYEYAATAPLVSLMDPEASRFPGAFPPTWDLRPAKKLESVDRLLTFGNSRLAFALLSSVCETEKTFGMPHTALVLRKVDDRWKVLLLLRDSLSNLEGLLISFHNLGLEDGQTEPVIPKVTLLNPVDHAQIPRYPPFRLEWEALGSRARAYVVESQFGDEGPEDWSLSSIRLVRAIPGQTSITMTRPFGVGRQPHRWRIWAISGTGAVSISDWRTIDFTN